MIIVYGTYSSRNSSQQAPDASLGGQHAFGPSAGFGEWRPAPPEDDHRAFMVLSRASGLIRAALSGYTAHYFWIPQSPKPSGCDCCAFQRYWVLKDVALLCSSAGNHSILNALLQWRRSRKGGERSVTCCHSLVGRDARRVFPQLGKTELMSILSGWGQ